MSDSTTRELPAKPHPSFPLTPHRSGKWCKKVKGRLYYFGRWEDPDGALAEWLAVKDDLLAGREPHRGGAFHALRRGESSGTA